MTNQEPSAKIVKSVHKVFKYATGEPIPEGAVYLSTITEDSVVVQEIDSSNPAHNGSERHCTMSRIYNRYVWHYFLVEVEDDGISYPPQK